ncbi:MAG: META domain-containing protein [Myxococcota bacterium]
MLSDETLRKLTYAGLPHEAVRLAGGRWEGPPAAPGAVSRPQVELTRKGIARGDLDGDGRDEAAVLLLESAGGSALNTWLAIVAEREGTARNVATMLLGDRIQIMRFAVADRRVVVEAVVAGADEPLCCPTRKVRRRFALADAALVADEEESLGSVGLADLGGRSWRLARSDGEAAPASDEAITLALVDGNLVGSAGCNRYFTGVTSEGGQQLAVGPIGSTRRACPPPVMEREQAFLGRLQGIERFGFASGELLLAYRLEGRPGSLVFEADPEDQDSEGPS